MSAGRAAGQRRDAAARLDELARTYPEWAPWLRVARVGVVELSEPAWDTGAPLTPTRTPSDLAPLLAGAELRPNGGGVARLLDRLLDAAHAQGLHAMAGTPQRGRHTPAGEALAVFLAAVNGDEAALEAYATGRGATPAAFRTLARLLPMPYLHACARRWEAGLRVHWSQGYCPVCGAWPAFAETRGVERSRHLRCGCCGAGWAMPILACTYCATTDHQTLGTLVVDGGKSRFGLDVCRACSGYLKSCTTLQATPPDEVLGTDLASVEFDLTAVERGFLRPAGPGIVLRATLAGGPA